MLNYYVDSFRSRPFLKIIGSFFAAIRPHPILPSWTFVPLVVEDFLVESERLSRLQPLVDYRIPRS